MIFLLLICLFGLQFISCKKESKKLNTEKAVKVLKPEPTEVEGTNYSDSMIAEMLKSNSPKKPLAFDNIDFQKDIICFRSLANKFNFANYEFN